MTQATFQRAKLMDPLPYMKQLVGSFSIIGVHPPFTNVVSSDVGEDTREHVTAPTSAAEHLMYKF